MKKKIFAALTAAVMAVTATASLQGLSVTANDDMLIPVDFSVYGTGCLDDEDIMMEDAEDNEDDLPLDRTILPTAVDLSADAAFPPIRNQGIINSCTAWATTYYTYTYMVHYAKGITSTYDNSYSPRWTYNLTNYGVDAGSSISDAFTVLRKQGALTNSEHPYTTNGNYSLDWSHDTQAMINALSTRADGKNQVQVPKTYTTSFQTNLNTIKAGLNNHTPYVVSAYVSSQWANATFKTCADSGHLGEYICVRNAEFSSTGIKTHAMTVVGYDDSIWCDVNGNGSVDTGETGAFKLANSWGTSWKNSGYVWVLYDALLGVSRINSAQDNTVTWDYTMTTTRNPVFAKSYNVNYFNYLTGVSDHVVGFVSEVTLSTSRRNQLYANAVCTNWSLTPVENNQIYPTSETTNPDPGTACSFSGTIVLNHAFSENISEHIRGYNYGVMIRDNMNDDYSISVTNCKIADSCNNTVLSYCSNVTINNASQTHYTSIDFYPGDVDYSGVLTQDDAVMILSYLSGNTVFSNVQLYLADYDYDGVVGISDVIAIQQHLANRGMDVSALSTEMQKLGL